ncbi:MAG: PD-(D/E)XK nuclease family protein [Desulfobacteraceae bacterium]|nr:MAG: PD-(D/E)XK nuclease family protein [Desulfobacteraceae bacterium]
MNLSDLRKGPHLSASSISDYIDCGLLYKFGRVDKLPMEFKSDALEFGSAIHMTLQEYYQFKLCGDVLSLKTVQEVFEMNWRLLAEKRTDIKYAEGKDFETLMREGKELLTVWYNKLQENHFKVLAIEEAFSFRIPGIPIPIIGATDLVEEDENDAIIVTDFKTSGRAYSADEVTKNTQLTIYQMAMKSNGYKGRDIYLKLDVLIKTKTPKFEPYWTTRSELEEKRTTTKIIEVWKGISKGVFVPNDNSWKCKGCHFKKACDQWFENGGKP